MAQGSRVTGGQESRVTGGQESRVTGGQESRVIGVNVWSHMNSMLLETLQTME